MFFVLLFSYYSCLSILKLKLYDTLIILLNFICATRHPMSGFGIVRAVLTPKERWFLHPRSGFGGRPKKKLLKMVKLS